MLEDRLQEAALKGTRSISLGRDFQFFLTLVGFSWSYEISASGKSTFTANKRNAPIANDINKGVTSSQSAKRPLAGLENGILVFAEWFDKKGIYRSL